MSEIELKPCPKCGGTVKLYSKIDPEDNCDCYAKCLLCKAEYPFKVHFKLKPKSAKIYPQSIEKAKRIWNRGADNGK